ncbi:MAG: hypothetical protein KF908_14690 [Nitrosomonas sp.]|nr:hypothetical protein [Nitrosomonas sp.]MCW5608688.1 hypothetical protein [Nitrosomonas sp.]
MKVTIKTKPSKKCQIFLGSLQKAVRQALERKRRFGQYATVIWQDGKPMMARDDAPQTHEKPA